VCARWRYRRFRQDRLLLSSEGKSRTGSEERLTVGMEEWRIEFHFEWGEWVILRLWMKGGVTYDIIIWTLKYPYKCELGHEYTTFLEVSITILLTIAWWTDYSWREFRCKRHTKGVSFGPQMRASHAKKSDSEIGPFRCNEAFHFIFCLRCDAWAIDEKSNTSSR
jgi:hypothetical protein